MDNIKIPIRYLPGTSSVKKITCAEDFLKPALVRQISHARVRQVQPRSSQVVSLFYKDQPIHIVVDSGATVSLITMEAARRLNICMYPTSQRAVMADGTTGLKVIGEAHIDMNREKVVVQFDALVVEKLNDCDALAGMNFIWDNDVMQRHKQGAIEIKGKHLIPETDPLTLQIAMKIETLGDNVVPKLAKPPTVQQVVQDASLSRSPPFPVHVGKVSVIMPGDYFTAIVPAHLPQESVYVVEPRRRNLSEWPPIQNIKSVDGKINIENSGGIYKRCQSRSG